MRDVTGGTGPHARQPIAVAGTPLAEAAGALILVHGRGGSADEMLGLAELLAPPRTTWLAPQAAGHTWYPHRFIEPVEVNEPDLGSALSILGDLLDRVAAGGILSGGLIGDKIAPPTVGARTFEGMPVLLGCSERDPHIPIGRVRETDTVMRALGAEVVTRVYPGGDHGINEDEVNRARQILARMVGAPGAV